MEIHIQGLIKKFGEKTAVDVSEFNIHHGDIVGLVGNNGAGKTTLFRMLLDLIKTDGGQVTMTPATSDGTPAASINPASSEDWKTITGAYIDEGFLIDFLTPEEYFQFVGKVNHLSKEETENRLQEFNPLTNGEILGQEKLIRNFAAGNKRKIVIISALLNYPQLLILDEPFNFLDPTGQNNLKHLLTEYNARTGATILISSHNLTHTVDISNRIALLEKGVVIKDMTNNNGSAKAELEEYFMHQENQEQ